MTQDAESYSVTISHVTELSTKSASVWACRTKCWDRDCNTTLHITPRYNWARVTRNKLQTALRGLRWLLLERLKFWCHKMKGCWVKYHLFAPHNNSNFTMILFKLSFETMRETTNYKQNIWLKMHHLWSMSRCSFSVSYYNPSSEGMTVKSKKYTEQRLAWVTSDGWLGPGRHALMSCSQFSSPKSHWSCTHSHPQRRYHWIHLRK